jgi:hypothetical protein
MRKLKQNILNLIVLIFIVGCSSTTNKELVASKDITVTGWGTTAEKSLENAFHEAVMRVAGAEIYSKSVSEDSRLVQNRISALSNAYITKYDIISKMRQNDGLILTKVNVVVKEKQLIGDLSVKEDRIKGDKDVEGSQAYIEIMSKRNIIQNALPLLDDLYENYPHDLLIFNKITSIDFIDNDASAKDVKMKLIIKFDVNDKYNRLASLLPYFENIKGNNEIGVTCRYGGPEVAAMMFQDFQCFGELNFPLHPCWGKDVYPAERCREGLIIQESGNFKYGTWMDLKNKKPDGTLFFIKDYQQTLKLDQSYFKKLQMIKYEKRIDSYSRYLIFHDEQGNEIARARVPKSFDIFPTRRYFNLYNVELQEVFELKVPVETIKKLKSFSFLFKI